MHNQIYFLCSILFLLPSIYLVIWCNLIFFIFVHREIFLSHTNIYSPLLTSTELECFKIACLEWHIKRAPSSFPESLSILTPLHTFMICGFTLKPYLTILYITIPMISTMLPSWGHNMDHLSIYLSQGHTHLAAWQPSG